MTSRINLSLQPTRTFRATSQHISNTLRVVSGTMMMLLILSIPIVITVAERLVPALIFVIGGISINYAVYRLTKLSNTTKIAKLYLSYLWLSTAIFVFMEGNAVTISESLFFSIIAMSSLFFGVRAGIFATVSTFSYILLLLFANSTGTMVQYLSPTLLGYLTILIFSALLLLIPISLMYKQLNEALIEAEVQLQVRKSAETTLNESENRYRNLIELSTDLILVCSDGLVAFINQNGATLLGAHSASEIIGKPITQFVKQTDLELVQKLISRIQIEKVDLLPEEATLLCVNGTELYVEVVGHYYMDDRIEGVQFIARDISSRKLAEKALHESQALYSAVVNQANDGILIAQDYTNRFVNSAFLTMTGFALDEVVDKPFSDIVHPDDVDLVTNRYEKRLTGQDVPELYEFRIMRKDGTSFDAEVSARVIVYEGNEASLALVRNIADRKKNEKELRESQIKLTAAFQNSTDFINMSELETGLFVEVNNSAADVLGYTPDEMIGKTSLELGTWVDPTERSRLVDKIHRERVLKNEKILQRRKDGSIRTMLLSASLMEIDAKTYTLVYMRDITETTEYIEALQKSEEKFSKAFLASPDSVTISSISTGKLIDINDGFETVFGYTREEALGKSTVDLQLYAKSEDRDLMLSILRQKGRVSELPLMGRRKSGELRQCTVSVEIIEVNNEPSILTIVRDVTDQEQARDAERRKTESLALINKVATAVHTDLNIQKVAASAVHIVVDHLDGFSGTLYLLDNDSDELQVKYSVGGDNRSRLETPSQVPIENTLSGRAVEQKQILVSLDVSTDNRINKSYRSSLQQSGITQLIVLPLLHQDSVLGTLIIALTKKRLITDSEMTALETVASTIGLGIANSIAIESVSNSQQHLIQAQKIAKLGSWTWDLTSDKITWTPTIYDIFAVPYDRELEFNDYANRIHLSDFNNVEQQIQEAIDSEVHQFHLEHMITRDDRTTGFIWIQANIDRDEQGTATHMFGTALDITERWKFEQSLRESEARFQTAFMDNPSSIIISRVEDGLIVDVNTAFVNHSGLTRENMIGKTSNDLNLWPSPEDREIAVAKLRKDGYLDREELRFRNGSGEIRNVLVSWNTIELQGEPHILSMFIDVTDQKRAEEALQASEERLRLALESSNEGLWDWNLKTSSVYVSPRYYSLLGFETNEFEFTIDMLRSRIHPLDIRVAKQDLVKYLLANQQFDNEYRILNKNNEYIWVQDRGSVVERNDHGEPTRVVGTIADITERKKTEQDLILQSQSLEHSLNGFSIISTKKQFIYANQAYIEMWGYGSAEELIGTSPSGHALDPTVPDQILARVDKDGSYSLEFTAQRKDKSTFEVLMSVRKLELPTSETLYISSALDITSRKRTESALIASEETALDFRDKLKALHEISFELAKVESLDSLYRLGVEIGIERLGFERLGLLLLDEDTEYLLGAYGSDEVGGVRNEQSFAWKIYPDSREYAIINSEIRSLYSDNVEHKGQGEVVGRGWDILSILWDGNKALGILSTDNFHSGAPAKPYAADLMALYGGVLGHLISRKRSELEVRKFIERLQVLQKLDRSILTAESPKTIADNMLEPLQNLLECQLVGIAEYDKEDMVLRSIASTIPDRNNVLMAPVHSDSYNDLIQNSYITVDDLGAKLDRHPGEDLYYSHGISTYTIFPLVDNDELHGLLNVGMSESTQLSEIQIEIALQVATQLAIVIRQAKMRETLAQYTSNLETLVEQRTAQLKAKTKELEAFNYSVSHDLRAPLRAISAFSQALEEDYVDQLPEDALFYLERIQTNSLRMGQLIDDLLALSRLGRKEMQVRRLNMEQIVIEVIETFRQNDQVGETRIDINTLPDCNGDKTLVQQLWVNVIANALKYSRHSEPPHIEIGTLSQDGEQIYYVKDNGVGFDMKYYDRIFGVFERLVSDSEFEGTGIGLAIVKQIVFRHNGKVWAKSELDKGATFYFTLDLE